MKIIFNKKEIEEIILAHVHREVYDEFNDVEFHSWKTDEFVIVTFFDKTEPTDET
jgi:hypothetical protein